MKAFEVTLQPVVGPGGALEWEWMIMSGKSQCARGVENDRASAEQQARSWIGRERRRAAHLAQTPIVFTVP